MPNPLQIIPTSQDPRLIEFVEANGIDPKDVPLDSHLVLNFVKGTIGFEALVRDAAGAVIWNPNEGSALREHRAVPLKVEPQEMGY